MATKTDVAQAGDGMDGAGCIALAWLSGAAGSLCFVGLRWPGALKTGSCSFGGNKTGGKRSHTTHNNIMIAGPAPC